MNVEENKSLKNYNTFGIDCNAKYFVAVANLLELQEALQLKIHDTILLLGGGSNMLITKDVDALVIHLNLKGIEVIREDDNHITLRVMAGENWHDFVMYCVQNGWGGIENLSLIPGNVGTAPIQNIGAYGVELKEVFTNCTAINIASGALHNFDASECKFGYRTSIFKTEAKGKFVITSVEMRLTKKDHVLNTGYGVIKEELAKKNIDNPGIADISLAVIAIRKSKLPDPKELGNSGSFFKNPIVDKTTFQHFQKRFPDAPFYVVSEEAFKIPAGWLIEQSGFKGKRFGDAGVHKNQALVLVNHGDASGEELWELAMKIKASVYTKFKIHIEPEVNII